MSAPTLRRPAPCLFCAFAASRRAPRLLSHVQKAYRSADARKSSSPPRKQFGPREFPKDNQFTIKRVPVEPVRSRRDDGPPNQQKFNRNNAPGQRWSFNQSRVRNFEESVEEAMYKVRHQHSRPEFLESSALTKQDFDREWEAFEKYVQTWTKRATPEITALMQDYRSGQRTLQTRLKYLFYAQVFGGRFTRAEIDNQKEVADLRHPAEWYPATRAIPRKVHLHVGPTNSGKTYHALRRLEQAKTGLYLGPLRLLAHEVYSRLNAKGRPCALVTGEEVRMPEGTQPEMWSCTVEMAPLNVELEVAVIDEIQMINHRDRGWAWTQAFLGLCAKEVHLCGEARTVPLMKELCALVGDEVHVHEYERLTPLEPARKSLGGKLKDNLQKGDCIVSFSVLGIHAMRKSIENATGRKVAIVYGSLPPETRAQQARLFNDPDNDFDFLVASDAIGMGLNLSIKRIIFETTLKNNGQRLVPLEVSEVKQIAGRAGRYMSAHQAMVADKAKVDAAPAVEPAIGLDDEPPVEVAVQPIDYTSRPPKDTKSVGIATTLENFDLPYLRRCLEREPEPIKTAGLFPPAAIVERFASYFPPGTPFSYILLRLHDISQIHPRYHLCALKDQLLIADAVHEIKNLTTQERLTICAAPTNLRAPGEVEFLQAMARCIADNDSGELLDLPIPLELLDEKPSAERKYLQNLEQLHKMVVLYLWLAHRFPNVFTTRGLANYTKQLVEDAIEKTLRDFSYTDEARSKLVERRRRAMMQEATMKEESEKSASLDDLDTEEDVPEVMLDVLKDRDVLEHEPQRDDENEYPTPELDDEESPEAAETEKSEAPEDAKEPKQ